MNQKLSRMTMTQSSIRDAVQISNNYNNGHVFQIITINTCLHVTSFVLLKGNIVFHSIVKKDELDTQVNNVHITGAGD